LILEFDEEISSHSQALIRINTIFLYILVASLPFGRIA